MWNKPILLSVLSVFLSVTIVSASARTFFVDPNGFADFTTIQAALNGPPEGLDPGDVIIVARGTYYEHINLNGWAITLQSTDPLNNDTVMNTVINGSNNGTCITFNHGEGANTIVKGFLITGGLDELGGGIYCSGSSPTISNCNISWNWGGSDGGGISNWDGSSPKVTNCTFIGNVGEDHGGGILNNPSCNPIITNCLFIDNLIGIYNGQGGLYTGSPTIINCTFAGNDICGIKNFASSMVVTNCILWDTTPIYNQGTSPIITYSDVKGGWLPSNSTNIDADPCFIDVNNGDFRLRWGSPCIDAANNDAVPSGVTTDLAGVPRFHDDPHTVDTGHGSPPVVDMGSYEYRPFCGDTSHPFPPMDFNHDCIVDFKDFGLFCEYWLKCTKPECD